MKTLLRSALLLLAWGAVEIPKAQAQTPALEFISGFGPTGNGITVADQTVTFRNNTNNPTGNTFATYTPNTTVTFKLDNQAYTNVTSVPTTNTGASFGGGNNASGANATPLAIYQALGAIGGSTNANFTSADGVSGGISTTDNFGVEVLLSTRALNRTSSTSAEYEYADFTITFNRAVVNPVLHFSGLGGASTTGEGTIGYTTNLRLITTGVTLSKLSGSNELTVSSTAITNGATVFNGTTGAGAASGSVLVTTPASGVTSLKFRLSLKGDGQVSTWYPNPSTTHGGDGWLVSVSTRSAISPITGYVFEDVNYGGGAGRPRTASGAVVRSGARVELYNSAGTFIEAVTTNAQGQYTFTPASLGNYTVRVVNSTVTSSRTGYVNTLVPVQTYNGTTTQVGGEAPEKADAANGAAGTTLASLNTATTIAQSQADVTVAVGSNAVGADFGFNFNAVVNTNNIGQGSLRQFIVNSNALGSEGSLAQVYTAADGTTTALATGRETSIFMIPNGTAVAGQVAGLVSGFSTSGNGIGTAATITLASALEAVTGPATAIDGTTQTRSTGNSNVAVTANGTESTGPEVILNLNNQTGLAFNGSNERLQGLGITGSAAASSGVLVNTAARTLTIQDNTIYNNGVNISLLGATSGNTVSSNVIRTSTRADGGGILAQNGTSNNVFSQNTFNNNTGLAIDLTNTTTASGNGVTINDNGDTDTGANGLLNFPILSSASISATNLVVSGFARPGAAVELYLASADPTGFGEGQTYLITRTEGATGQDSDTGTGSYGPATINGLTQGTDNTNRFTFTIPLTSLDPAQVAALQSGAATLTSTATVSGAGTSEFSGNLALPVTDITVSIAGPTTLYAGQPTGTYTATFTNEGPITATAVTRTVTLPTGATLAAAQLTALQTAYPGTTYDATNRIINFGSVTSLAVNATSTVSFSFTAPSAISTALALTATTSTTSSEGADNAPNTATLSLSTVNAADVTANITAATVAANATTGTFNVSFANNGAQQAAGVAYTVQLPAGLNTGTAVTVSNNGSYNNTTGLVTFPAATLNSGATFTSTITYLLGNSAAPVTAVARVATTTDEAGRTANNVAYATMGAAFDLTTTLSGPTSVIDGSPTTLFVTTTNNGPNTVATATQTVQLPTGLSQVFVTNGGTYNSGNGTVTFPALSDLPGGQTVTNSISFVAPATNFNPSAAVSTTSGTETNTDNNSANLAVTVNRSTATNTNMATAITANQTVVAAGAAVTYTVTATNQGPTAPTSVTQRVQLLPGLTTTNLTITGSTGALASGTITFGSAATYNVATGVLTYTNLTSGNGVTVGTTNTFPTIVVTTPATVGNDGQLLATATATSNLSDAVPADNVASVAVKVRTTPDVTTTISGPSSTVAGLPVSYVVRFANNGATTAATLTETAQLPANLTDVTITDANGNAVTGASYASATGLVTFPNVVTSAPGASQTFVVTLTAPAQTFPVASAITSVTADGVSTNNSALQMTTVTGNADLAVAINGPETAVIGNPVTYTVTMTNNGPTPATNAVATLQLPTGLAGVQVGPSIGTSTANYDSGTGLLTFATVPTLTEGGSLVNYVTFTMPNPGSGQIIPVATVSTTTTDAVASNNTAALTTSIAPVTTATADLLTSITSDITTNVTAGATITYTIAYRNQAGSTATNVVRSASLPTGLAAATLRVGGVTGTQSGNLITFNSGPASGATYDVTTGQLTFPTLATLAVSTTATSFTVAFPAPVGSGQLVVVSEIASATSETGAGANRANSSLTVNTNYDVTTSLAGPTTATPGTINTYTVTTRNAGPSAASSSTTQTVTLPTGLTTANLQVDGLTGTGTATITFTSGGNTVATYTTSTGALAFPAIANLPAGVANAVVHSFSLPMSTTGNLALSAAVTSANETNSLTNSATLTTTPLNIAPVAQNVWNTLLNARGNTANITTVNGTTFAGYGISPLNATDVNDGGSIANYTILTLPAAAQGVLYLNGSAVAANQTVAVADVSKLTFAPASGFVGNATFTYTATDNGGLVAPAALYTIPVAQDISSTYTVFNTGKGRANPYVTGDVLAQITDLNEAIYNNAGLIYNATTGVLQTGASNGLPTTGTNAVLVSGTLPTGVSLDAATGRIFVSDARLLVNNPAAQDYTVTVRTTDSNGGTNTVTTTFRLGAGPLPVTLVSFTAQAAGQDAKLMWNTAQELNNDRFVVERSFDAITFQTIGEVKGQGTTTKASNYSFTDAKVGYQAKGTVYYRLRQVDTDGTSSPSTVQTVHFSDQAAAGVEVYPNPTSNTADTRLNLSGLPSGTYQVVLTDMAGRTVRTLSLQGGINHALNVSNLPLGSYIVTITGNGQTINKRLIKE